jgi:hypothetical protein
MKNTYKGLLALAVATTGLFAFEKGAGGSITGKIIPASGATEVWAISNTDTLKAPVQDGTFMISSAKPATYKLAIDAVDPFKDVVKEGIVVIEDKPTNVGDIQLEK